MKKWWDIGSYLLDHCTFIVTKIVAISLIMVRFWLSFFFFFFFFVIIRTIRIWPEIISLMDIKYLMYSLPLVLVRQSATQRLHQLFHLNRGSTCPSKDTAPVTIRYSRWAPANLDLKISKALHAHNRGWFTACRAETDLFCFGQNSTSLHSKCPHNSEPYPLSENILIIQEL